MTLRSFLCEIFGHKPTVIRVFDTGSYCVLCRRCRNYFLMSDSHRCILPWDSDFSIMYAFEPRKEFMKNMGNEKIRHGSNNVFKDLGYKNPDAVKAKADTAIAIDKMVKKIVGINAHELGRITIGLFHNYSIKKLEKILELLKEVSDEQGRIQN